MKKCSSPAVPANLGPVLSAAACARHTCAIKADGSLVCFGHNEEGQCTVPADLGPVLSMAAGFEHTRHVWLCLRCGTVGTDQSPGR